jgi:hypothetical protein
VEDARLGFWVGAAVAEATVPPSWRAGDEFEARRKAALEAAHAPARGAARPAADAAQR